MFAIYLPDSISDCARSARREFGVDEEGGTEGVHGGNELGGYNCRIHLVYDIPAFDLDFRLF
jgi:hypothetical protein